MLKDFQKLFIEAIINENESDILLSQIIPSGTIDLPSTVLNVHRQGYYARLTEALGETFEGSWFAMGDELFFEVCEKFIRSHPSTFFNLSNYGKSFPKFLRSINELEDIPFIKDLAEFDWQFKNVFHSKQHESVSNEQLQKLEQNPTIKFEFGESVILFKSDYAVYNVWQLRKGQVDDDSESDFDIDESLYMLMYKNENNIFSNKLSNFQYHILENLMNGLSFEKSLEDVSEVNQDDIISLFQIIASTGIVSKVIE